MSLVRFLVGTGRLFMLSLLLLACSGEETSQQEPETISSAQGEAPVMPPPVECEALEDPEPQQASAGSSDQALSPALQTTFDRTCKMCHTNPAAGAPLVGDAEAWAPRLAQGRELLLDHTIDGYRNMPPLGLCMACSEEDFLRLIEYMADVSLGGEG